MSRFGDFIFGALCVLLVLVLVGLLVFEGVYSCSKTVVETYTVSCEVTQVAYAEETVSRSSSRPVYRVGVRNDDFAATLEITSEQFAMFAVGDIVEVEVTVYEWMDGEKQSEYKVLGLQN